MGCRSRSAGQDAVFHLGTNKEVFDSELHALYQASKVLETRNKLNRKYTVFSDSAAAISRARSDSQGPGQRLAECLTEVSSRLPSKGNTITVRWTPGGRQRNRGPLCQNRPRMRLRCCEELPAGDQLCPHDESHDGSQVSKYERMDNGPCSRQLKIQTS